MRLNKNALCSTVLGAMLISLICGCAARYYEDDKSPKGLFMRAEKALKEHRFNEAHFLYDELAKNFRDNEFADDAIYKRGYLEIYLGKYADAQSSFADVVKNYSASPWRFDASLWEGLLGELSACKAVESRSSNDSIGGKNAGKVQVDVARLQAENEELRKQIQKLRALLEE